MTTIAFAGAARITAVHALAAQALGLRVTHVASHTSEGATELATRLGARACHLEDLPAGADLVVVTTPPSQHAVEVVRALRGGSSVLVDAPLAATLADADTIVDAATTAGPVVYGESLLFAPIVRAALSRTRALGPIQRIEVRALHARAERGDAPAGGSGGVLFEAGVHPLAVALALAEPAEPIAVRARLDPGDDLWVDDHAEVELRYPGGLVATVVASWREDTPVWDLQASSATGVVRAELLPTLSLEHDGEPVPVPGPLAVSDVPQLEQFGYLAQLESLVALAAGRQAVARGPGFGRLVLEVVCAAYRSAAERAAWQALPFAGPRDRTPLQLWGGS